MSHWFTLEDRRGRSNSRASRPTQSTCPWDLNVGKEGLSPDVWFPSSFTLTPDTTKCFCSQGKDDKIKGPLPISLGNSDHHWQAFSHPMITLILPLLAWQAANLSWFQLLEINAMSWAGGNTHTCSVVKNGSGEKGQAANGLFFFFFFTVKAIKHC